mmetsp:Transcript_26618/g.79092  ORF Transcript_26618/g.79092 Transcript_26618/m.79092 type:complete len:241 (-) Transcript_26618:2304-3026(-)
MLPYAPRPAIPVPTIHPSPPAHVVHKHIAEMNCRQQPRRAGCNTARQCGAALVTQPRPGAAQVVRYIHIRIACQRQRAQRCAVLHSRGDSCQDPGPRCNFLGSQETRIPIRKEPVRWGDGLQSGLRKQTPHSLSTRPHDRGRMREAREGEVVGVGGKEVRLSTTLCAARATSAAGHRRAPRCPSRRRGPPSQPPSCPCPPAYARPCRGRGRRFASCRRWPCQAHGRWAAAAAAACASPAR